MKEFARKGTGQRGSVDEISGQSGEDAKHGGTGTVTFRGFGDVF